MPRLRREAGFTLIETLIASAIMLTIIAATFTLVNPADGIFKAQPELADLQQRVRVSVDAMAKDLLTAGAGFNGGSAVGPLFTYLPPVVPYRVGDRDGDPPGTFHQDVITVLYVPVAAPQGTIRGPVSIDVNDVEIAPSPNCPPSTATKVCGFEKGMRVLLVDAGGRWDTLTVTDVQPETRHLQFGRGVRVPLAPSAQIAQLAMHTYYLKANANTGIPQLMHYDGEVTDSPLVDHVVKIQFDYFGDAQPPVRPAPPDIDVDDPNDTWPAGENCVFAVVDGRHVPRLPVLASGSGRVTLTSTELTDGPWCPDGVSNNRFDADLLRIRRVHVRVRVQVAMASLRGPAGVLFTHGGTATSAYRYVPDQEISFDISPRNMTHGR